MGIIELIKPEESTMFLHHNNLQGKVFNLNCELSCLDVESRFYIECSRALRQCCNLYQCAEWISRWHIYASLEVTVLSGLSASSTRREKRRFCKC